MGTRGAWANDLLAKLGNTQPTLKTQNLVAAWTVGEDTEAKYNPLATTLDYGDNTKFNNCCGGNGVKNYKSRTQGLEATVQTLLGNHPGYADIVSGLRTNDPDKALVGMKYNVWGTNFVRVETIWRSRDVRNEPLKSEDSTPEKTPVSASDPVHTPLPIRPGDLWSNGGINHMGPNGSTNAPGGYYGIVPETPGVNADNVRKYIYYIGGSVLALTSGVLFIIIASKTDAAKSAIDIAKVVAV